MEETLNCVCCHQPKEDNEIYRFYAGACICKRCHATEEGLHMWRGHVIKNTWGGNLGSLS